MKKIDPKLQEQLATLIAAMGYELVGCEIVPQGRQALFRIYIDSPGGVSVDDCAKVSHQVSAMFDVEEPVKSSYRLEISSPGIDRPLFEIKHYHKYIGKTVKLKLRSALNQRRQYKGILLRVEGENIYLQPESGEEIVVPFSEIEKGQLIGDVFL